MWRMILLVIAEFWGSQWNPSSDEEEHDDTGTVVE